MKLQQLFLTFFYTGNVPKAPGTAGSIAGWIVGLIILKFFSISTLSLLFIVITIIGILEINKYEITSNSHDNQEIVIDEVVGVWLAMIMAHNGWFELFMALVLFRVYDILKPSFIGRIDRNVKGGLGVMGDDIGAGFMAGISVLLLVHGYAKFLG